MEHTITGWRRYALVQPSLMIVIFAQAMSSNILTDLIVYRTCSIILNINKTECLLLHENSSSAEALRVDTQVQPKASLILMTKSIVESIIPTLLSLFLGPWSDSYGRKPIMLSGYVGIIITNVILSFMTVWDINPWFLLLAYIPYACFGGFCVILLGTICYITDISNEQDRGWQLAWMEALISVGLLTGILIGPVIFQAFGYTAVFTSTTLCCILAGLHICFFVPETMHNIGSRTLNSIFDIHLVTKLIRTCTRKRNGFHRSAAWCCILCIMLMVIALQGETSIGFLFASARLGWDVKRYSIYVAVSLVLRIAGIIFGVKILATYIGLSEEVSAILAISSSLCACIMQSFTLKPWHMYLSAVLGMLSESTSPMIRAVLSKSVPLEDIGKVFSMTVSIEMITPFVGASLYNMIYSHFMPPIYPSPVWLVSAGINIIMILILVNVRVRIVKCSPGYTSLTQESEVSS